VDALDGDEGDDAGGEPARDFGPRLGLVALPRSDGMAGHDDIGHGVGDDALDEAGQVGLGQPQVGQKQVGVYDALLCSPRWTGSVTV
jgi:hypothetical protein